jgi:hypothetical protein
MTMNHGVLLSCRDEEGQTLKGVTACGGVSGFDAIVQPRLRKLAMCPAASGATSGKLSVVFNLDFVTKRVGAEVGKSSTVPDVEGFTTCVKSAFQGVSLGALDHQNPRYAIAYNVTFSPGDHTTPDPQPSINSGGGVPASSVVPSSAKPMDDSNVEVAWEVAIVRDAPRTGQVVARLPRGTKVHLGQGQDGWYKIQYGTSGSEGWVYRGAVAR